MIDRMAEELRSLNKSDATILFRHYWDIDRDEMCTALAKANLNTVKKDGNMYGRDDVIKSLNEILGEETNLFNFKEMLQVLKQFRDQGIDFDDNVHKLHSLIAKISLSCTRWTKDTIELLLSESEIARGMIGTILVNQASVGCSDSIDDLLEEPRITNSDIDRALVAAVIDNDGSDNYTTVIESLLETGKVSKQTVEKVFRCRGIKDNAQKVLQEFLDE